MTNVWRRLAADGRSEATTDEPTTACSVQQSGEEALGTLTYRTLDCVSPKSTSRRTHYGQGRRKRTWLANRATTELAKDLPLARQLVERIVH